MTCAMFPAAELLAAVQSVAPKTTLVGSTTKTSGAYEPLECDFQLEGHQTDVPHPVDIRVVLNDGVDQLPSSGQGQQQDRLRNKKVFDEENDKATKSILGDATSESQELYVPSAGLGDGSYFKDYIVRDPDSHAGRSVESALYLMRGGAPFSAEVWLEYNAHPDSDEADIAPESDPFQNEARHTAAGAIAKVILTKLDAVVASPPH